MTRGPGTSAERAHRGRRDADGRGVDRRRRPDDDPVLLGLIAATQATRLEALDDPEFEAAVLADLVPFAPGATATG